MDYVPIVNEFSERRRNNSLFENGQSPAHGVQVSYVNSSTGNLTFARRDLVRLARLPLVATRVYDSGMAHGDFGPGWHLSWSESIDDGQDRLVYVDETRSRHEIVIERGQFRWGQDLALRARSLQRKSDHVLAVQLKDGWTKTFQKFGGRYSLQSITANRGGKILFEHDADGRIIGATDADGKRRVTITRLADGRIQEIWDDLGRAVHFDYSAEGNLVTTRDVGGNAWRYFYDPSRRLNAMVDPAGTLALSAQYDGRGRVEEVISRGRRAHFEYAGRDTIVRALGKTTRFAHGTLGRVTSAHSGDSRAFRLSRNAAGLVTALQVQDAPSPGADGGEGHQGPGGLRQFAVEYDGQGRVALFSRSSDLVTEILDFEYDGDVIRAASSLGEQTEYRATDSGFELLGQSERYGAFRLHRDFVNGVSVFDGDAGIWRIEQDEVGMISRLGQNGSADLELNFDARARPVQLHIGADSARYDYDQTGFRRGSIWSHGFSQGFTYDASGNLVNAGSRIGSWQRNLDLDLDSENKVTTLMMNGERVSAAYDPAGNLVLLAGAIPGVLEFGYDTSGRLASVSRDGRPVATHQYRPFEKDLRLQDDNTGRLVVRASRATHTYGTYEEIYLSRNVAAWDWFHYDGNTGLIEPADVSFATDEHLRFLGVLSRLSVDISQPARANTFDKASNVLFLPAEMNSVNCVICEVEPQMNAGSFGKVGQKNTPFENCFPVINTVRTSVSRTGSGIGTASVPNGVGEPATIIPYNERVTERFVLVSVYANQELVQEELNLGSTTFLVFGNLPNTPSMQGLGLYDASHRYEGDGGPAINTTLGVDHIGGRAYQTFSALASGVVQAHRSRPHLARSTTELMAFSTTSGLAVAGLVLNSIAVSL